MPRREDQPVAPLAPYAVAKLAAERYVLVAHRVFGLETVALRYFNVFGERQDPNSGYAAVIPKFIRLMLAGERPVIHGDGTASRDFTHIENVVQANLAAAGAPEAVGRVINVAMHDSHTINELVQTLNRLLSTTLKPIYGEPRPGDVPESLADISLAKRLLGYAPGVSFEEGLVRTIEHISDRLRAERATSLSAGIGG
jgi:UDP-glucose 4-epimerase